MLLSLLHEKKHSSSERRGGRLLSFTSSATNKRVKYTSEARFMFYWDLKTLFVIVMVFGYQLLAAVS